MLTQAESIQGFGRTARNVAGRKVMVRIAIAFISELSCLAATAIWRAVWLYT